MDWGWEGWTAVGVLATVFFGVAAILGQRRRPREPEAAPVEDRETRPQSPVWRIVHLKDGNAMVGYRVVNVGEIEAVMPTLAGGQMLSRLPTPMVVGDSRDFMAPKGADSIEIESLGFAPLAMDLPTTGQTEARPVSTRE